MFVCGVHSVDSVDSVCVCVCVFVCTVFTDYVLVHYGLFLIGDIRARKA